MNLCFYLLPPFMLRPLTLAFFFAQVICSQQSTSSFNIFAWVEAKEMTYYLLCKSPPTEADKKRFNWLFTPNIRVGVSFTSVPLANLFFLSIPGANVSFPKETNFFFLFNETNGKYISFKVTYQVSDYHSPSKVLRPPAGWMCRWLTRPSQLLSKVN